MKRWEKNNEEYISLGYGLLMIGIPIIIMIVLAILSNE